MENRISQTELENLYKREIRKHGKHGVEEIVKQSRNTESEAKNRQSIFLCHSHHDKTIVQKIILFFNNLNINIYVDWMDEAMPKVTNSETAQIIKTKIENANRFLFLATYFGLASKWCDWELGVAYSTKKINDLAILPIESKSGKWKGSEYLQLYPVMQMENSELETLNEDMVWVQGLGKKKLSLKQWLTQ